MKDRRNSPRRRAILVLVKSGRFTLTEIARVLQVKTRDVMLVIRKAM